jgi:hypothetical protein
MGDSMQIWKEPIKEEMRVCWVLGEELKWVADLILLVEQRVHQWKILHDSRIHAR